MNRNQKRIFIQRVDKNLEIPKYSHPWDSGVDLRASSLINRELLITKKIFQVIRSLDGAPLELLPGDIALVSTGIKIALPDDYEAQIRSRSGLALQGLIVNNAPGTVDSGYRGEVSIILKNNSPDKTHTIHYGDRLAQMVVQRVEQVIFEEVDELPDSSRSDGGFGSTG